MITLFVAGGLIAMLLLAAIWDLRTRRVPNLLTASGLACALLLRAFLGGGPLLEGLVGFVLASAVAVPLFAMGALGGGDSKLLMAVGAFLGPKGLLVALLGTALAGGVLGVGQAIRSGVVLPALHNTAGLLTYAATLGRKGERVSESNPPAATLPYGVAIALGSLVALFLGGGI